MKKTKDKKGWRFDWKEVNALLVLATNFCLWCPNCDRQMPNLKHLNSDKKTCKWCKKE